MIIGRRDREATDTKKRVGTTDVQIMKPLSPLEQLPTELLEEIFLMSRNLNLCIASSSLYAILNPEPVRRALLISAFSLPALVEPDCTKYHDSAERWPIQRSLLGQKWLGRSMLLDCQAEAFWNNIKEVIGYVIRDYDVLERAKIRSDLSKFLLRVEPFSAEWDRKGSSFLVSGINAGRDPAIFAFKRTRSTSDGDIVGISVSALYSPFHSGSAVSSKIELIFPYISRYLRLSGQSVRGPWTEEKLSLLKLVCDAMKLGTEDDHQDASLEDPHIPAFDCGESSEGLVDAIREYNIQATAFLARPDPSARYVKFYRNLEGRAMGRGQDIVANRHPRYKLDIETSLFELGPCYFKIPVSEKHLVAALEAAEAHDDPEITMFRWLQPLVALQQYESLDDDLGGYETEPFLVAQWATRKIEEDKQKGVQDGIGSKVLRMWYDEQRYIMKLYRGIRRQWDIGFGHTDSDDEDDSWSDDDSI